MKNKYLIKLSALLLLSSSFLLAESMGDASWYGEKYQGKATASGEPFDMYAYTAAHRTYAFGTMLTVTNLENGKSVEVRVNDRGPHKKSRIVDLSFQAAKEIGIVESGVASVKVEESLANPYAIDDEVNRESIDINVQIASFTSKKNANIFLENELTEEVNLKVLESYMKNTNKTLYKVVVVCDSESTAKEMIVSQRYKGAYLLK